MQWQTTRGTRQFACGDRVMFLRNERELGVKNGTLGRVDDVTAARMTVMLDDGRSVGFDAKRYADLDYGYAATIHKAQGMTVDRVHVLATPGLDRHAAYVERSRHRESVQLHYGRDDFADADRLAATLSRERSKDMAQDYTRAFADQRQIVLAEPAVERPPPARHPFTGLKLGVAAPARPRSMFDGLKLSSAPLTHAVLPDDLERAVQNVGKAAADIQRMRRDGYTELPHQRTAYDRARDRLDAVRPAAAQDLRAAFIRDMSLIEETAAGQTVRAIRAMALEAELRVSPERRADRFVEDWQKLARTHRQMDQVGDGKGVQAAAQQMTALGHSMERDAEAESLVRKRLPTLGLPVREDASIFHSIQDWLGRSRGRGIGR